MKFCKTCKKYCRDDCHCFESHKEFVYFDDAKIKKEIEELEKENKK